MRGDAAASEEIRDALSALPGAMTIETPACTFPPTATTTAAAY
jgi:hypothetical protein